MKPYPSYKESGIEWIGEIPSEWDIIRTKFLTDNLDGKRVPLNSEERGKMRGDYPYWGSNGVVGYVDEYLFDEDLVLVGEDGSPFFDRYKDVSFYVNNKVWVNNHIHVLRIKDSIHPKILVHSFNCVNYRGYITGSTRDKLNQADLKDIPHPVPPHQEQQQISNYLDHKTQLIDSLIEKTQQKIELLKEQRTSLINEAVTKGLNPDVEMKDSGIEWIGKIPSGWTVKKVSYLCKDMISGPFGSSLKKEFYTKSGYKIYGQEQVINDDFEYGDYYIPEQKFQELRRCEIFTDDILISCVGTFGKISIVPNNVVRGIINPRLLKITPNKLVLPNYFLAILRSNISLSQFQSLSRGGTMGIINLDILRKLRFPIPPTQEQQQIIDHLDKEKSKIDSLIKKETQRVDLLKEYRQSLISEVVTGKVDVRDEVAA